MRQKISAVTTILIVAFIFSNSLRSGGQSQAQSEQAAVFLEPALELLLGKGNVTQYLIRKLAHFAEFGMLGFSVAFFTGRCQAMPFLFLNLVAMTDETLQLLGDRSCQVQDVWLDLFGGCTGFLLGLFVLFLIQRRKRRTTDLGYVHLQ